MSYHGSNSDYDSYNRHFAMPRYRLFSKITNKPEAPQVVLNPNDPPMKKFLDSYNQGYLNINSTDPLVAGNSYYTINTGYGKDPVNPYAVRPCAGALPKNLGYGSL